jgi:hypothetical protein
MKKRGKVKKVSEIWEFYGFCPFRESDHSHYLIVHFFLSAMAFSPLTAADPRP